MNTNVATAICVFLIFTGNAALAQEVVWSEEFSGETIDPETWTWDVGGHGFGNGQLEFNTNRRENSYVRDGHLFIEARRENHKGNSFTSARMLTQGRFAFQYGTLEARIKVPDTANGIWPAFWMLGNNFPAIEWPHCGEVDILEIGGKDGIAQGLQRRQINCALHFSDSRRRKTSLVKWFDAPVDLNEDFHRYRISWTPQMLKFFLDDKEYGAWDISKPEMSEYHQPHFLILNMAVGSWASSYTAIDTLGKVTATFPAKMQVDWIRLYANPHTKVIRGRDVAETGNFGVYSEDQTNRSSLTFGDDTAPEFPYSKAAAIHLWNNMTKATKRAVPSEGKRCLSWDVTAGDWFGMGVFVPNHRNMINYEKGSLRFDIRTKSPVSMKVGVKSSRGGEAWVPLGDEKSDPGFLRDGKWQSIAIPVSRFDGPDLRTVHQLFMLAGDAPSSPLNVSVDNIRWQQNSGD